MFEKEQKSGTCTNNLNVTINYSKLVSINISFSCPSIFKPAFPALISIPI